MKCEVDTLFGSIFSIENFEMLQFYNLFFSGLFFYYSPKTNSHILHQDTVVQDIWFLMIFVSKLLGPSKIYVIRMYYVKKNCIEKLLHCYKGNLRTAVSSYDKPLHMNYKNIVAYGKYLKKTKKQSKKVNKIFLNIQPG